MKGFLAAAIGVLLVAGGLAVALDRRPTRVTKLPVAEIALRPGQTEITGFATFFKADNAVPDGSIPLPFTVPRGQATITDALVGGKRSTIAWDGGRPLVVTSLDPTGELHVRDAAVEIDAGGVRWTLDGANAALEDGRYRIQTPVAVGTSGLAQPRDRVDFESDGPTTLTARGGAVVAVPLTRLVLTGPGTVRIEGRLLVRTSEDESARPTEAVTLQGSYEVVITPGIDGLRVMGLFQRG